MVWLCMVFHIKSLTVCIHKHACVYTYIPVKIELSKCAVIFVCIVQWCLPLCCHWCHFYHCHCTTEQMNALICKLRRRWEKMHCVSCHSTQDSAESKQSNQRFWQSQCECIYMLHTLYYIHTQYTLVVLQHFSLSLSHSLPIPFRAFAASILVCMFFSLL